MKTLFTRFAKDESGATAIEYGLIATLIGVAIIVGAGLVGTNLNTAFHQHLGQARNAEAVTGRSRFKNKTARPPAALF